MYTDAYIQIHRDPIKPQTRSHTIYKGAVRLKGENAPIEHYDRKSLQRLWWVCFVLLGMGTAFNYASYNQWETPMGEIIFSFASRCPLQDSWLGLGDIVHPLSWLSAEIQSGLNLWRPEQATTVSVSSWEHQTCFTLKLPPWKVISHIPDKDGLSGPPLYLLLESVCLLSCKVP